MVLIVDDDNAILCTLTLLLEREGYAVRRAATPEEAMAVVRAAEPELVLLDMNFSRSTSGAEGITLLRQIRVFRPAVPVILMTAWGNIDLAVEGMRAGAADFVTKPWDNRRLLERVATAIKLNAPGEPVLRPDAGDCGIITADASMQDILGTAARVAPTNATVLITGESGTGKELVARYIHEHSPRVGKAFVKVNLGGLPSALFESEMFGHVRGAFTDALSNRTGRFEAADGGTIFLDEIGELDLYSQVKLLRVLQEQTFEPLGSSATKRVDVRVLCATNADLRAMVTAHTFREDLYWRINQVRLHLPPLRARGNDIRLLAHRFAGSVSLAPDALDWLEKRTFTGNIRELKNIVESACLLCEDNTVTAADLARNAPVAFPAPSTASLADVEREAVAEALRAAGGNVSRAAAILGISRGAFYRRMEKYGL